MRILVLSLFILLSANGFSQKKIEFYQKNKIQIKVKALNNFEKLEITTSANNKIQTLKNIETSMTGKEMRFSIEDYNFDGSLDFASYHLDDGMGVYTIYQIFIYNPADNQFTELKIPVLSDSECDEFCDVQVNRKKKTLQSSCRGGASWHTDIWKFDAENNLILIKE